MVAGGSSTTQWSANTGTRHEECNPGSDRIHGRIQYGMGSEVGGHSGLRVLDDEREGRVNKRQRVESNSFCDSTPRSKRQKQDHAFIHRQYNSLEICQKTRRYLVHNPPKDSSRDSRTSPEMEYNGTLCTHSRDSECRCRQAIEADPSDLRAEDSKKFFQMIETKWGKRSIDAFATRVNAQTPRFWSRFPDPEATAVDAFLQKWPKKGLYLFPPWKLIPRVIHHLQFHQVTEAVLVTPHWPSQFWYPMILRRIVAPPLHFRISRTVHLTAWQLSGKRGKLRAWQMI